LDIAIPNGSFPVDEPTVKKIREAGCDLWFYNIGSNRFTYGYYLMKTRPRGRLQWNFGTTHGFAGQTPSLPSLGSTCYASFWNSSLEIGRRADVEQMRQGILDYRYLLTLDNLLNKKRDAVNPNLRAALDKGQQLRTQILDGIHVDIKHYAEAGFWSDTTCHRLRWRIAQSIQEISNAEK